MKKAQQNNPLRPAEWCESRLVDAILDGVFPIDSSLPAERELAGQLGVTRPTLREALQRLERDGWIEIHHGKPTRVCDYWREGNLAVLSQFAMRRDALPDNFVPNLLMIRQLLAPTYIRLAVENAPDAVAVFALQGIELSDSPTEFADFDWRFSQFLTITSGNPVFIMILNGFKDLFAYMGERYFSNASARAHSRGFYTRLRELALARDFAGVEQLTQKVMADNVVIWRADAIPPFA